MANDITSWLDKLGLGQYAKVFADNAIDSRSLPHLSEDDLKELGLPLGHRRILQAALNEFSSGANASETARSESSVDKAERRQLTILFCDLVGSTALSAALDPEDMRAIIAAYHRCCAKFIEQHGGFVAKYMGDGVLAYFGYPHAHEHDAERAVQAGISLIDAVPKLTIADDSKLCVRVGIATGTVVVGDLIGSGEAQERGVVGETPNLAARLQAIAGPGMVVISESTRRLLGNLFELEDLGKKDLKGIKEPVRTWAAVGGGSVESRFDALRAGSKTALVGREEESELILQQWYRAKAKKGGVVLLSGEAGIGKSHLTFAMMERIAEESHSLLRYFCSPQHVDSALHPVIVQMERAARLEEFDNAQARLDKLDNLLAKTSTSIEDAALFAELLSISDDGRYPTLNIPPPQRRKRTLQALIEQIKALANQSPTLIVFEDAHWSDPTSQEFLDLMVDHIASLPVLLIVSLRSEFKPQWIRRPHITELLLNRLAESEVAEMIDRVIGTQSISAAVRQNIIDRTDGNPLFVEEMTKAVIESESNGQLPENNGAIPSPDLTVPASLHASLVARLDRLGSAKEIVQIGAAIGREFSYKLLATVTSKSEFELEMALDRLVRSELLLREGITTNSNYYFKHALVQDAAYSLLLREPRRAIHARIAETLESQFYDIATNEPEIIAFHFSKAGLADSACLYFERAGDRSVARSAYAEAVAHFNAALEQAKKLPPGIDRSQRELTILLKQGPAVLTFRGQRSAEYEQIYQRAFKLAESTDDEKLLFKSLWGLWLSANLNRKTDIARDRAEDLVVLGKQSGTEELILEAIHCRWSTAFFRGDVTRTLADACEGIKQYNPERHSGLSSEFGGHDPGVCAHIVCGISYAQSGASKKATESTEQAINLAQKLNQQSSISFAIVNALTTYELIDNRSEVTRLALMMIELANEFDLPAQRSVAIFLNACANATGENLDTGLKAMESELQRVLVMGSMPVYYTGLLARVRLTAKQVTQALESLEDVLKTVREPGVGFYLPEIHRLRGECFLSLESRKFDEAVNAFEMAISSAKQQQASVFQLKAAIDLARAWSSENQAERGVTPLREAASLFTGDDVPVQLEAAHNILSNQPN